jgi:hypothetical protein
VFCSLECNTRKLDVLITGEGSLSHRFYHIQDGYLQSNGKSNECWCEPQCDKNNDMILRVILTYNSMQAC